MGITIVLNHFIFLIVHNLIYSYIQLQSHHNDFVIEWRREGVCRQKLFINLGLAFTQMRYGLVVILFLLYINIVMKFVSILEDWQKKYSPG